MTNKTMGKIFLTALVLILLVGPVATYAQATSTNSIQDALSDPTSTFAALAITPSNGAGGAGGGAGVRVKEVPAIITSGESAIIEDISVLFTLESDGSITVTPLGGPTLQMNSGETITIGETVIEVNEYLGNQLRLSVLRTVTQGMTRHVALDKTAESAHEFGSTLATTDVIAPEGYASGDGSVNFLYSHNEKGFTYFDGIEGRWNEEVRLNLDKVKALRDNKDSFVGDQYDEIFLEVQSNAVEYRYLFDTPLNSKQLRGKRIWFMGEEYAVLSSTVASEIKLVPVQAKIITTTDDPTTTINGVDVTLGGVFPGEPGEQTKVKITVTNGGLPEIEYITIGTSDTVAGIEIYVEDAVMTSSGENEGEAVLVIGADVIKLEDDGFLKLSDGTETSWLVDLQASETDSIKHGRIIVKETEPHTTTVGLISVPTGEYTQIRLTSSSPTTTIENDEITFGGAFPDGTTGAYKAKITVTKDGITESNFITQGTLDTLAGLDVFIQTAFSFGGDSEVYLVVGTDFTIIKVPSPYSVLYPGDSIQAPANMFSLEYNGLTDNTGASLQLVDLDIIPSTGLSGGVQSVIRVRTPNGDFLQYYDSEGLPKLTDLIIINTTENAENRYYYKDTTTETLAYTKVGGQGEVSLKLTGGNYMPITYTAATDNTGYVSVKEGPGIDEPSQITIEYNASAISNVGAFMPVNGVNNYYVYYDSYANGGSATTFIADSTLDTTVSSRDYYTRWGAYVDSVGQTLVSLQVPTEQAYAEYFLGQRKEVRFDPPEGLFAVDDNNNGIYDTLTGTAKVTLNNEIGLTIAELVDANGKHAAMTIMENKLDSGDQTIELTFTGSNIRETGRNGPYHVKEIITLGEKIQILPVELESGSYTATKFEKGPIQILDYTDTGRDMDGDGDYDQIVFNFTIEAQESTRVDFMAFLAQKDRFSTVGEFFQAFEVMIEDESLISEAGILSVTSVGITLESGTQQVEVAFPAELIYAAQANGPYTFPFAMFFDEREESVFASYAFNIESQAYTYDQFEKPPVTLIEGIVESPTNTDGTAEYNYLDLTVNADIHESGTYNVRAYLKGADGKKIDYLYKEAYLEPGAVVDGISGNIYQTQTGVVQLAKLNFRFSGNMIRSSKANGPYTLEVRLTPEYNGVSHPEVTKTYTTAAYNYIDFEASPLTFTGENSEYLIDTNEDGKAEYLVIKLGVHATEAGNYNLMPVLVNDDGRGFRTTYTEELSLDAGESGTFRITLNGVEINERNHNGPYTVKEMHVENEYGVLDIAKDLYTTQAYNAATDFQQLPFSFTGWSTEDAIDADGDGLYETLVFRVGVKGHTNGDFRLKADVGLQFTLEEPIFETPVEPIVITPGEPIVITPVEPTITIESATTDIVVEPIIEPVPVPSPIGGGGGGSVFFNSRVSHIDERIYMDETWTSAIYLTIPARDIYEAGLDQDYLRLAITDIQVIDEHFSDEGAFVYEYNDYVEASKAYYSEDFEEGIVMLGSIRSDYLDNGPDEDSYYEYLVTELEVKVQEPGTYTFEADLYDSERNLVTTARTGQVFYYGEKEGVVYLRFHGKDIGEKRLSGPFTVENVRVIGQRIWAEAGVHEGQILDTTSEIYTTEAYASSSFEPPRVELWSPHGWPNSQVYANEEVMIQMYLENSGNKDAQGVTVKAYELTSSDPLMNNVDMYRYSYNIPESYDEELIHTWNMDIPKESNVEWNFTITPTTPYVRFYRYELTYSDEDQQPIGGGTTTAMYVGPEGSDVSGEIWYSGEWEFYVQPSQGIGITAATGEFNAQEQGEFTEAAESTTESESSQEPDIGVFRRLPRVGKPFQVWYHVQNHGKVRSTGIEAKLYEVRGTESILIDTVPVESLSGMNAGSTATGGFFNWTPRRAGAHTLRIVVTANEDVNMENNENSVNQYVALRLKRNDSLIDRDHDGIPDIYDFCPLVHNIDKTSAVDCITDFDGDGLTDEDDTLIGNGTHMTMKNFNGLRVRINDSGELNKIWTGVQRVKIMNGDRVAFEFDYNFSERALSLPEIHLERQNNTSTTGFALMRGLTLPEGVTKTVRFERVTASNNAICIRDVEVSSITEMSDGCNDTDEVLLLCDGATSDGYTCTIEDGVFVVSGLHHSAVKGDYITPTTPYVPPANTGGGGGGGGGSTYTPKVEEPEEEPEVVIDEPEPVPVEEPVAAVVIEEPVETTGGPTGFALLSRISKGSAAMLGFMILLVLSVRYKDNLKIPSFAMRKTNGTATAVMEVPPITVTQRMTDLMMTMEQVDQKIIEFLIANQGKTTQARVHHHCQIPRSTLSKRVNALRQKNIVHVQERGKVNDLGLTDWFLKGEQAPEVTME